MQFRRDGSTFFFLIIVCFIIILFYQHHYASNQLSRIGEFYSEIKTNEKFRSSSYDYSSIRLFRTHCFQIKDSDKPAIENLQNYLNNARISTNEICQ